MTDTDDIVQDALVSTVKRLPDFVCRTPGALLAYFRRVVFNRIVDEMRKCARQADCVLPRDDGAGQDPSPLQRVLGKEEILRYRSALMRLNPRDRQLIKFRVEQRLTYREIGIQLGMSSPNAARVASRRATGRFAAELKHV